jgi:hypothetical protein
VATCLGHVLLRRPVPDAEAQRLRRETRLAQHPDPLRDGATGPVTLARAGEPAQGSLVIVGERQARELDERVPPARVAGELLGQRPDREVGGPLAVRPRCRGERIDRGVVLRTATDDLREGGERRGVVRVEDQPQERQRP